MRRVQAYLPQVSSFWKLLVLFAVLLMPFGMAPAAAHGSDRAGMTAMAAEHCPGTPSDRNKKAGIALCTMACAAALPAAAPAADPAVPHFHDTPTVAPASQLTGLHPETATPPPRAS